MAKNAQKVMSVRVPKITYDLLVQRSEKEDMSASALIRNILIGFLRADETELDKIRCYGASKAQNIARAIEGDQ